LLPRHRSLRPLPRLRHTRSPAERWSSALGNAVAAALLAVRKRWLKALEILFAC